MCVKTDAEATAVAECGYGSYGYSSFGRSYGNYVGYIADPTEDTEDMATESKSNILKLADFMFWWVLLKIVKIKFLSEINNVVR